MMNTQSKKREEPELTRGRDLAETLRIRKGKHHSSLGSIPAPSGIDQNCIVKVEIVKNPAKLKSHINYMEREGTGIDGEKAELYNDAKLEKTGIDAEQTEPNIRDGIKKYDEEKHFFKVVISPEETKNVDLEAFTKDVMKRAERNTGQKFEWYATAHSNTRNPHVHVLIRGVTEDKQKGHKKGQKKELFLDPRFIKKNFRDICRTRLTQELGPRSQEQILRAKEKELTMEKVIAIDRKIENTIKKEEIKKYIPQDNKELRRLQHLTKLNLAQEVKARGFKESKTREFILKKDFVKDLNSMEINKDIRQTLHRERKTLDKFDKVFIVSKNQNFTGKIVETGMSTKKIPYVVVENNKGRKFYYSTNACKNAGVGRYVRFKDGHISGMSLDKDLEAKKALTKGQAKSAASKTPEPAPERSKGRGREIER